MGDTESSLRAIVGGFVRDPQFALSEDTSFDEAGLDSLDMLMVVDAIETQFGLKFADEDFAALGTFGDAYRIVAGRIAAA